MSSFDPGSFRLIIDIEEKWTGDLWRGDFSTKYVEEITQKTGTPKKYGVFVNMLVKAFKLMGDLDSLTKN